MSNRKIALYIRLSVEDSKTDSLSIDNQRKVLHQYLENLPEYADCEVLEMIDNGYSGTNLERPKITELLNMVRENKIACILCKDFSRFSRNMLEMGYFFEKVFPLFGTRFISVSDRFDSNSYGDNTGGIDVTFKYLVSEYYSKDLSVKSKAARHAKMKRGEYVSTNMFYGYMLDEDRNIVIDEEAADVIRLMFKMTLEGHIPTRIQNELYKRKVLTPSEYKASKGKKHTKLPLVPALWTQTVILNKLRDERYTGTYIMGKSEVKSVGSRGVKKKDESSWYKIPDHYPAIIDRETFDKANAMIIEQRTPKSRANGHLLTEKVYCGTCGHRMAKRNNIDPVFHCRFSQGIEDFVCDRMGITASVLENIVFTVMKKQAEVVLGVADVTDISQLEKLLDKKNMFETQMEELHKEKRSLYEQYILEELTIKRYQTKKKAVDAKLVDLMSTYSAIKEKTDRLGKTAVETDTRINIANDIKNEKALSQKLVDLLVDRVLVYPNKEVEIIWKFKSFAE
ncbi:recombinase family protein [Bengtsoniella intestinalis]|uniref:recombinase family protein n=1 Tax=Bengtsoniella intestinalis TaxID=3073143 RepID=UPI00391F46D4